MRKKIFALLILVVMFLSATELVYSAAEEIPIPLPPRLSEGG